MIPTNEKQLLNRLSKGDSLALKELFDAYHPRLYRKIYLIVRRQDIADDLAQQVFIRLWEKRFEIQVESNFGAYLMKMGVNEALTDIRKKKNKIVPLTNQLHTEIAPENSDNNIRFSEQQQKIDNALKSLPDRCREIFLLSRQEFLTYQQIATKLSISKKTVEAQMGKALMLLRKNLLLGTNFVLFTLCI